MAASSASAFNILFSSELQYSRYRFARSSSASARILTARAAALRAASTPTAATGMAGGIWATERRASTPMSEAEIGSPMTGSVVCAAITPGSAALIPAAAMITFTPLGAALRANSSTAAGVRWALRALSSNGTARDSRKSAPRRTTGRSDVLPIIMLTMGFIC